MNNSWVLSEIEYTVDNTPPQFKGAREELQRLGLGQNDSFMVQKNEGLSRRQNISRYRISINYATEVYLFVVQLKRNSE